MEEILPPHGTINFALVILSEDARENQHARFSRAGSRVRVEGPAFLEVMTKSAIPSEDVSPSRGTCISPRTTYDLRPTTYTPSRRYVISSEDFSLSRGTFCFASAHPCAPAVMFFLCAPLRPLRLLVVRGEAFVRSVIPSEDFSLSRGTFCFSPAHPCVPCGDVFPLRPFASFAVACLSWRGFCQLCHFERGRKSESRNLSFCLRAPLRPPAVNVFPLHPLRFKQPRPWLKPYALSLAPFRRPLCVCFPDLRPTPLHPSEGFFASKRKRRAPSPAAFEIRK